MSSIINATTTNGLKLQPDNSGSLVLQTNNGTTAVTVDTSQNTTLAGKLTTASSGIQFSDSSIQTAAASPYVLKNRIINGDMRIDQRNAGASVTITSDGQYTLDRWQIPMAVSSKVSIQQNAGSVTPPAGYSKYLGATSLAATTLGSADYYTIRQNIEGFNWADLDFGTANAKTVTLSFWVRSSLTGTFAGALQNNDESRCYPFTYTISSANTWEQKTVTITGCTDGTWQTTTSTGARLVFNLGSGTTNSGTASAWASTWKTSVTGSVNMVNTNGATLYITGVQLEIGSTATPFERRLYNQELANCQRYYAQWGNGSTYYAIPANMIAYNSTSAQGGGPMPVPMRTAPSLSVSNFVIYNSTSYSASSNTLTTGSEHNNLVINFWNTSFTGLTTNNAYWARTNLGYFAASAEL